MELCSCSTENISCREPCQFVYNRLAQVKPQLIQEIVAHDPWKLLVAVTLLNKTSAKVALPVFWKILAEWPSPWSLSCATEQDLADLLKPLGTQNIRSKRLIRLSKAYIHDPPSMMDNRRSKPTTGRATASKKKAKYPATPISHLPGTGTYALDSYRIFCTATVDDNSAEWKTVQPTDKQLIRYLRWKWAFVEHKKWDINGPSDNVDRRYLDSLIHDLSRRIRSHLAPDQVYGPH